MLQGILAPRIGVLLAAGILAVGWLHARPAYGVPATPEGVIVQQPSGEQVMVFLRGDERAHWYEDAAGYLILKSAATGEWVYAVEQKGVVKPTTHLVGKVDPAAAGIAKPDRRRIYEALKSPERAASEDGLPGYSPIRTGTLLNLVILVNYADLAVTNTRQEFDDVFNKAGYSADGAQGSVKDYYKEVSYGKLTVQSIVVEPVTISKGYAYYGANDEQGNDIEYRVYEMVFEALAKLEARGFDFKQVDGNGDGWIDGLTIIHAGGDEAYPGNDENYIWSQMSSLPVAMTYDGVSVQVFHTEAARRGFDSVPSSQGIARIGTICHEMGHFLGLPDLYDYGDDSAGAGYFCLMAAGPHLGDGITPSHPNAWCKADMGWLTPTVISGSGTRSLSQVETTAQAYKLQGELPPDEYFLVENRQGVGFDRGLPGPSRGILIWHVDESESDNDHQTHYKVDLEEPGSIQHLEQNASNLGDDLDYFRAGNATSFTDDTEPDNYGYLGWWCGAGLTNISAPGAVMTFSASRSYPLIWDNYLTPGNRWDYSMHLTVISSNPADVRVAARMEVLPPIGEVWPMQVTSGSYQNLDYVLFSADAVVSRGWEDADEAEIFRDGDAIEYYPREVYDTDNNRHFGHGLYTNWQKADPSTASNGTNDTFVTFLRVESITVPAGTFFCVVVKIRTEWAQDDGSHGTDEETAWFHPVFGIIKSEETASEYDPGTGQTTQDMYSMELTSSNLIQWALFVRSSPEPEVAISGDFTGTTDFTMPCADGQVVNLTAPAVITVKGIRWDFTRWTIDEVDQQAGKLSVQVTMNDDHEVVAVYEPRMQTLTVQSTPVTGVAMTGSAPGSTSYAVEYPDGQQLSLIAPWVHPAGAKAARFTRWKLDTIDQPLRERNLLVTMDTAHTAVAQYADPVITGDVNGDCKVNILDLIFVRSKLNQSVSTGDVWKADVNDDGKINILDLINVRAHLNAVCPQ